MILSISCSLKLEILDRFRRFLILNRINSMLSIENSKVNQAKDYFFIPLYGFSKKFREIHLHINLSKIASMMEMGDDIHQNLEA